MTSSYAESLSSGLVAGQIAINPTTNSSMRSQTTVEETIEHTQEDDTLTLRQEDGEPVPVERIITYLRLNDLLKDCWCVQTVANQKEKLHEIVVHAEVDLQTFVTKLFTNELIIDGHKFKVTSTRCLKETVKRPLTKVMIYEAPFHLRNDLILQKLANYGTLQDNKMVMYKHKGTEVYTGARSINFKTIYKPIPTVLFVHGNRCKIKHVDQDRTPICGICRTRGHFRDDCPQLPLIQSFLEQDRHDNEPEPPELKSWAQAHQYVKERQEHRRILHREVEEEKRMAEIEEKEKRRLAEMEENEKRRLAELEEKENRRRMLLKKRHHVERHYQQTDSDDMATGTQEEDNEGEPIKQKDELEEIIDGPESKKKKKKGRKKKKKNEPPSQHISPVTTPGSSPYHPDIGESNGTVCGSQPNEDSTSLEEDSDENPEVAPMEKDDDDMNLDLTAVELPEVTNSPVISSSYPPPGQEAGKEWAAQMDERDRQLRQLQQQQQQQQQQHQ